MNLDPCSCDSNTHTTRVLTISDMLKLLDGIQTKNQHFLSKFVLWVSVVVNRQAVLAVETAAAAAAAAAAALHPVLHAGKEPGGRSGALNTTNTTYPPPPPGRCPPLPHPRPPPATTTLFGSNISTLHASSTSLGCTICVLPGSAMRALSTFSPLFVSQGPYPPFSPICLTLSQFVNGGSAVKFRGTRGGTSAAKNDKNFTAEAP